MPQMAQDESILELRDIVIPPGIKTHDAFTFDEKAILTITGVSIEADVGVLISNYTCTPGSITITTAKNSPNNTTANITVYGIALKNVYAIVADEEDEVEGDNILDITNDYIQTPEHAAEYKQVAVSFIISDNPELSAAVRGNPLLQIGDKIQAISVRKKLNYTGIIKRAKYTYMGSLSGNLH